MTRIISLSVSEQQDYFLKAHKNDKTCSPTFLLRKAINEKMQEMGVEMQDTIQMLDKKLKFNIEKRDYLLKFVNDKGLIDEFLEQETRYIKE